MMKPTVAGALASKVQTLVGSEMPGRAWAAGKAANLYVAGGRECLEPRWRLTPGPTSPQGIKARADAHRD